jgi:tRNA 2-thiouridine synthesizing protein C
MKQKRILIVYRRPPYGESFAREALDVAMAGAAFDQSVALLFLGAGVAVLAKNQQSDGIQEKSLEKQFAALPLYDVNELYVDADALRQYHFSDTDLSLPAQLLDTHAITQLLERSDIVLNF